jgi:DNA-directed RNA polymerase subunit RPC12/RpoP
MSCHTCGSKGVRIEKTKDYKEADIDEFNWDDDEWDIIVCNKCGSQDVEE